MRKINLLFLPAVAAISTPAMAQNTPAGFRAEALIGYDVLVAEFSDDDDAEKNGKGGLAGGVGVGYDFPMGSALSLGADAELILSTTDVVVDDGELNVRRDIYVGGRITGRVSDTINVYAKAGYTNLRLSFDVFDEDDDEAEFSASGNLDGVRGAVGVQFGSETRSYYGLEYRYSNYEADVERHQGMLFIGYRF